MGDPKKKRKQYSVPRKRWDKERIGEEEKLTAAYGLRNKREIRRAEGILRKKRHNARVLLPLSTEERGTRSKELLESLDKMGLLKKDASLDDVLGLTAEEVLERRLQTIVWRKDLARTITQARQFITHGHIAINGRKIDIPGYIVTKDDEPNIGYFGNPPELMPKQVEDLKKKFDDVAVAEGGSAPEGAVAEGGSAPDSAEATAKVAAPKEAEPAVEEKAEVPNEAAPVKEKTEAPKAEVKA